MSGAANAGRNGALTLNFVRTIANRKGRTMDRLTVILGVINDSQLNGVSVQSGLALDIKAALADINWRPIADLPEELKDGRTFLVGWVGKSSAIQAAWRGGGLQRAGVTINFTLPPTHFCEINPPEADSVRTNKPEG